MTFEKTITVKKDQVEKLQALLDMEEVDFEGLDIEEDSTLATFTATFENGFSVDTNVCSGQHNCWVDTILYNPAGHEIALDEPSDELLGTVCFSYGGNEYRVHIVEE